MGLFVVSTGFEIEKWIEKFKKEEDDYSIIMLKILADRLAEAFAELMHYKVRKEIWGYSPNEIINQESLRKEKYRGIRPAPGYAACPEHSEKRKIFDIMNVEQELGVKLTEQFAMYPAASVSGYYFANPMAKYFNVGKISKDQLKDYSMRKRITQKKAESLLNANLNYS
jgi:5-methyltetrahydrofolate--homocysteine methyltransferase